MVDGNSVGQIGLGLLVLLGVGKEDTEAAADYVAEKIIGLRIVEDEAGKMNLSVQDKRGDILVVSQFTLYGDVRRGKRPSFDAAARPEEARLPVRPSEPLRQPFVLGLQPRPAGA